MSPEPTEKSASSKERQTSPIVFLALIAFTNLTAPWMPMPSAAAALFTSVALTIINSGAIIGFALGVARLKLSVKACLGYFAIAALFWLALQYGLSPYLRHLGRHLFETRTEPNGWQRALFGLWTPVQEIAMMVGCVFAGAILARMIRHANMIGPIGGAIALIDIWGVLFQGPLTVILNSSAAQPIAEKAMAAGPKIQHAHNAPPGFAPDVPSIGAGDFLFIALFLCALVNLNMNWKSSARWMWVAVSGALLSITFTNIFLHDLNFALPGLLFIGGAAILPNLKYSRFTREEQFALLYAGIFVVLLTIGIYFGLKATLPPAKPTHRNGIPGRVLHPAVPQPQ